MKRPALFLACLLVVLPSLNGCVSLDNKRWKERAQKCYQTRDAEVAAWPERLEEFPVAGLQWLGVIREERKLEREERECVEAL